MRLALSQKEKLQELFQAVELLFNNKDFGVIYSEIEEAWLVGGMLRDLLLFKNPPIEDYDFYFQVKSKEDIFPWLSRLTEHNVPFEVLGKSMVFNEEHVYQIITLSLHKYDIDYEINIIVGNLPPKDFIMQNFSTSLSLIGLDISDLFVSLAQKESVEKIIKKIWTAPEYKRDVKNKSIGVLKQEWMKNQEKYPFIEVYLEKIYKKLESIGFE